MNLATVQAPISPGNVSAAAWVPALAKRQGPDKKVRNPEAVFLF